MTIGACINVKFSPRSLLGAGLGPKARNITANPACTISVRTEGIDLVFEGEAIRVTDAANVEQAATVFRD